MTLRVLICDERPMVSDGLGHLLAAEPDIEVIGSASDERLAMSLLHDGTPEVVLTGLRLADADGPAFVRRVHDDAVAPAVVVYTVSSEADSMVDDVVRAGAAGVLAAEASREELLLAIRAAGRGQAMLGPSIARRLVDWFRTRGAGAGATAPPPEMEELTKREREILRLTARGLSADEIAAKLYIGVATVRTHLYRSRCKLNLRDRAQLVTFAYQAGLMEEAS
jgi:DNA-binding NarL/FixJ family response regulator